MSNDQFANLLKELEVFFKCPLAPDSTNCCLVQMPTGLKIQISQDRTKEHFCIAARIGEVPTHGKYREQLFRAALTANGILPQDAGVVAFSDKSNNLILFIKLPMKGISADKAIPSIELFIANATKWIIAMQHSEVPTFEAKEGPKAGPFGM